jgi:hypothetical protein
MPGLERQTPAGRGSGMQRRTFVSSLAAVAGVIAVAEAPTACSSPPGTGPVPGS